jgi:UDP-N-acetylmuramoyl-L-alanyl-D-glutamate--2,6-diaminopimelate ligase
MQNYKQAKLKFFNENKCKFIVCNTDDDMGIEIASKKQNVVTYGIDNPADVFAIEIKESKGKTSFVINLFDCIYNVKTNFIGKFNVSNALAATTTCALMGVKPNKVIEGIEKTKRVEGRLELIYENDFKVYIDYAHTPDGIEKSIKTLKSSCEGRLICVFGCGGNRDKGKREIMGEISSKYADFTIVTSDNPRFEDPMSIIREIEKGILRQGKNYVLIEDRVDAIEYALNIAKKGDAILIAGKGSEKYQEVLGVKKMYNDKETIIDLVGRRKSD